MILDYDLSASDSATNTTTATITAPATTHTPGLADIPYALPIFIGMIAAIVILLAAVIALAQNRRFLKAELDKLKGRAK